MIRVNLLGEKVDYSVEIATHALILGASVLVVFFACGWAHSGLSDDLTYIKREKRELEKELEKLKKVTERVQDLESKQKTLREKLLTIAHLKAKKHGPVRVLDTVNTVLPERAWVDELEERDGFLEIQGVAFDNQTIADFMNKLGASDYFGDVDLVLSRQKSSSDDTSLKEFLLRAQIVTPMKIPEIKPEEEEDEGRKGRKKKRRSKKKKK